MKMKWSLIALVAVGIYAVWANQVPGEFDETGNAKVALYVLDGCSPCDQAAAYLKSMRIEYDLLNPMIDSSAADRFNQYGTREYPLLVIGDVQTKGFSKPKYTEAYARAFGLSAIAKRHQRVYQHHFDGSQPKVVMYGTSWCGYCAKARKEFANNNIEFTEWDVEKNERANARFKQLDGTGYPLIFVGFERMHEYNKSKVKKALARSVEPI